MLKRILSVSIGCALSATLLMPCTPVHAQIIRSIAGTGVYGSTGDGGPATAAAIGQTFGVIADNFGNVYFGESQNNRVRKISSSGIITTIAGTGSHGFGGDGGPATAADLAFPSGISFDTLGNLYISDPNNSRVRKVDPSGIITTFAGTGAPGFSGDGGPASAAQIGYSDGVFADLRGNVFIPDPPNHRIRKVDASGTITTYAGNGSPGHTGDGGPATAATLTNPADLSVDLAGNLYFTDFTDHYVRKIDPTGIITTLCGNGTPGYTGDGGPATAATLNGPVGIYQDNCGNIYIGDRTNNAIRKINAAGIITTVCGNGTPALSGDGGPASAATLNYPHGIFIDHAGNMYIADRMNYVIRKITAAAPNRPPHFTSTATPSFSVCANVAAISLDTMLAAIDSDLGQDLDWTAFGGAAHGTLSGFPFSTATTGSGITPSGLKYVPALTYSGADTFSIAVNDCYSQRVMQIVVTVDAAPVAGSVSGTDSLCNGKHDTLTASVTGGTWVSAHTAIGTISAAGIVTAVASGADTVWYIVSNACGNDTARFPLKVRSHASCAAGIEELPQATQPGLVITPNPSHGIFSVVVSSPLSEAADLTLTDVLGRKLKTFTIPTNTEAPVDLPAPPGVYLLSARTSAGTISTRVVFR